MTKEEVRAVSIAKLDLTPGAVLYDVGAGTGSISIEASRQLAGGRVYAIERDPEALSLLEQNRARFGAEAVRLVPEEAPEAFAGLAVLLSGFATRAAIGFTPAAAVSGERTGFLFAIAAAVCGVLVGRRLRLEKLWQKVLAAVILLPLVSVQFISLWEI